MYWGGAYADITFEPTCNPGDVLIDTVEVEGTTYHTISIDGFPLPMTGIQAAGLPSVPFTASTFLLPSDMGIDTILIISASWDTLPGRYYLYPAQSGSMEDTTFATPDPEVYNSTTHFPSQPVSVSGQGSAMGYSVAALSGTPVRYIPADSILMILTSVTLNIQTGLSEFERIVPLRETEWSASVRNRGIIGLVANPLEISYYQQPAPISNEGRTSPLNILDSPSVEGDGADMVIITSGPNGSGPDLTSAFQELADYRTAQGIITIVRTVHWIENFYSGCDTPEKIRNFIRDAHEKWGVQAVLLGGDDWVVPVRECGGDYFPSDDYYSDIDGDWRFYNGAYWIAPTDDYYVDLILGRWPVDNAEHVDLLLSKLKLYEWPDVFPNNFAREMLFIGGSHVGTDGKGAVCEEYLKEQLENADISGPAGDNLDVITELYYPQSGTSSYCNPAGDNYFFSSHERLSRTSALDELDQGYNLIIHADHSGIDRIGAAREDAPQQFIHDFDFEIFSNFAEPSILWTLGCWPGHFEGADCFAEAGLLTSGETGLVAMIAFARNGWLGDWLIYYSFIDALYPFGWIDYPPEPVDRTVSYIGEAYRYSMNFENSSYPYNFNKHKSTQNLFGDPAMFVWRNDPHRLDVNAIPATIIAGVSTDITVTVTDSDNLNQPVAAEVCLYKDGDLYATGYSDDISGTVVFSDIAVAHSGQITVTAVKRRDDNSLEPGVFNFIPGEDQITVSGTPDALINLEDFTLDDDNTGLSQGNGDGVANPGETIEIDLDIKNLGIANATHTRAQLTLISGDVLIENDFVGIGTIPGGSSMEVQDAFRIKVSDNADENDPVLMEIEFIYDQGSWESPCDFSISSDEIELPLHSIDVSFAGGVTVIDVSNILAVNTGIGAAEDIEIHLDNFSPAAVFSDDVSIAGDIAPGTSAEAPSLHVECTDPPPEWQEDSTYFQYCTFEIVITDRWDRKFRETITVSDYDPDNRPESPSSAIFITVEAGQDYINVKYPYNVYVFDFNGGFYLYFKESGTGTWDRSNLLPIPVEQFAYSGLESSTRYDLAVTAVDEFGQESSLCLMENAASTVCTMLDGWPVQLEGGTGSGPLVTDIIGDVSPEIIAVTDFGNAYILSGNGQPAAYLPSTTYRYTGCAVGNMDTDSQLEIVVACQVDITAGIAGIVIYDLNESTGNWEAELVCQTGENEECHEIFGTPVLVDAGPSIPLNIALRTRSGEMSGNYSKVHVWRWDSLIQEWVEYSPAFPVTLDGGQYYTTPPVSSDWDDDGNVELLVASDNQDEEPCIFSIDIDQSATPPQEFNLTGALGASYCPYSSLATVEWGTGHYLTGAAKGDDETKKVFVLNLDTGVAVVDGPYTGGDFYSLMGGPAIGDFDGDGEPDFVFALNSMCAWDLNCSLYEGSGDLEANPHDEDGDAIRSPSIFAGSNPATLVGYSTKFYVHDPDEAMAVVEGFPSWTEDKAWAAPVVADIDEDGLLEILVVDNSGFMSVFDWNGSGSISNGWPMFQHDRWRSGNYDIQLTDVDYERLDFNLLSVKEIIDEERSEISTCVTLIAEVNVTGSGVVSPVNNARLSTVANACANASRVDGTERIPQIPDVEISTLYENVDIGLFNGNRLLVSSGFFLFDGIHSIELTVPRYNTDCLDRLIVKVDPDNEYTESDEINNVSETRSFQVRGISGTRVFLQSPCKNLTINMDIAEPLIEGITVKVYSIEGRLVADEAISGLLSGSYILELDDAEILPAGLYTVIIEGISEEELVRQVVVLP
ncbi:MAG: hypothetical protein KAW14_08450 [Candidatus Aegiribacteria sp.]|nr:hypothetical protein [Candidatus Aegiribacteria sp.]